MCTVMRAADANSRSSMPSGLATLTFSTVRRGQGNSRAETWPSTITWRPVSFLP